MFFFLGKDVQTKWKSLRDRHIRYLRENKSGKSGDAAKKKKTYVYAKHLDFLKSTIVHNNTEDSQLDVDAIPQDDPTDADLEAAAAGTSELTLPEGTPTSTRTYFRRKRGNFEDKLEKYMDVMTRRDKVMEMVEDEDFSFFRSLLPSVKKLPVGEKLQFQSDVLHLLISYNNRSQNQNHVSQNYQPYHGPHHSYLTHPVGTSPYSNIPGPSAVEHTAFHSTSQTQFLGGSTRASLVTDNNDHVFSSVQSPTNSETSDSLLSLH